MTKQEREAELARRVRRSNELVQSARYKLSVPAQRILLYLTSRINPDDTEFREENLVISDFCELCGIHDSGGNYKILKDALWELLTDSAKIWFTMENGNETPIMWIERPEIDPKNGKVTVKLDKALRPYLLNLKANFTQYELVYTTKFHSKYSFRLYELAKSYQYHEETPVVKVYTVDEMKTLLGAEDYERYSDFNKRVIKPATNEINSYTDRNLVVSEENRGRKVMRLRLDISAKQGQELDELRERIGARRRRPRSQKAPTVQQVTPVAVEGSSTDTRDYYEKTLKLYEKLIHTAASQTGH